MGEAVSEKVNKKDKNLREDFIFQMLLANRLLPFGV